MPQYVVSHNEYALHSTEYAMLTNTGKKLSCIIVNIQYDLLVLTMSPVFLSMLNLVLSMLYYEYVL